MAQPTNAELKEKTPDFLVTPSWVVPAVGGRATGVSRAEDAFLGFGLAKDRTV